MCFVFLAGNPFNLHQRGGAFHSPDLLAMATEGAVVVEEEGDSEGASEGASLVDRVVGDLVVDTGAGSTAVVVSGEVVVSVVVEVETLEEETLGEDEEILGEEEEILEEAGVTMEVVGTVGEEDTSE